MSIMFRFSRDLESGFTLIEILITITIIGILAAIAVPLYFNYQREASIGTLKSDVSSSASQAAIYKRSSGAYPTGATFDSKSKVQSSGNTVTISVTDLGDGTQHACVQGVRTFSSSDVVRWNYNLTTNKLSEGTCSATTAMTPEVPS